MDKQDIKQAQRSRRGFSILEMVISMGILTVVLALCMGFCVQTTQAIQAENSQAYVQGSARAALQRLGADCRAARLILPSANIGSATYTMSDGKASPACLILQVPSQDASGTFHFTGTASTPHAPVTDAIVYRLEATDHTLRRTTVPAKGILASDGQIRSSYRVAENDVILLHDVSALSFVFRDAAGAAISGDWNLRGAQTAFVDVRVQMSRASRNTTQDGLALTGIRLRNMHSGHIDGTVNPAANGTIVEAIVSGGTAYPAGTPVSRATSTPSGAFIVSGLMDGAYRLRFTTRGGAVTYPAATYAVSGEQGVTAGTISIN